MFDFKVTDPAKNPDMITNSAALRDEAGNVLYSVIFFNDDEVCGLVSIADSDLGQRNDSVFLHFRPGRLYMRAKHSYGILIGGVCVEAWS
jgi:hypothetical protein